ncbi:MAG: glycosyltransferase family 4 protein [Planctomycetota bacterium]
MLVTQHYTPEPHDQSADLARELAARGHQVQVITSFPSHPLGRTYEGWRQRLWREQDEDGVLVTRIPQYPDHSRSTLRRAAYYLSFVIMAVTIGLWRSRANDVVLVYQAAAPVNLAGWALSRWWRSPMVIHVVDLWPDSLEAAGVRCGETLTGLIRRFTSWAYRAAARVVVITPGYAARLVERGLAAERVREIPMWSRLRLPEVERRPNDNRGGFRVVYAGAIGPCQDLGVLVEAAQRLRSDPRVAIWVVGDGAEREALAKRAAASGLNNLRFIGPVPTDEVGATLQSSDSLLLHLRSNDMSRVSIPSKLIDYLAAERPVIAAIEGCSADLVRSRGCGLVVPPNDSGALAAAIRRLANEPELAAGCRDAARATHATVFGRERGVTAFEEILSEAAGASAAQPRASPAHSKQAA